MRGETNIIFAQHKVLERLNDPKHVHAKQRPMQNLMFHRTVFLNTEDYKPTMKACELMPKRKTETGSNGQPSQKKAKKPQVCDAPLPTVNPWKQKSAAPTRTPPTPRSRSCSLSQRTDHSSSRTRQPSAAFGFAAQMRKAREPLGSVYASGARPKVYAPTTTQTPDRTGA